MSLHDISKRLKTDVLVVGAGAAGIRAAIAAHDEGSEVVLLERGKLTDTGSSFTPLAYGWGFRAAMNNSIEDHLDDILKAGLGLTDKKLAKILVEEAPARFRDLQRWGLNFKRSAKGDLIFVKGCFGKRSYGLIANRMKNIQCTFYQQIMKRDIKVLEKTRALKLKKLEGQGFLVLCLDSNLEFTAITTKTVVLASGGAAAIFSHNLNHSTLIGDGLTLGLDAGAEAINMEFIQFIYGVMSPVKTLISERIFCYMPEIYEDVNKRTSFIDDYIPENITPEEVFKERAMHGPFSTRGKSKYLDIGIFEKICKKQQNIRNSKENDAKKGVLINLSPLTKNGKAKMVLDWLRKQGIDPENDDVIISPCAHAFNGGLHINEKAMTSVEGLFAAGEIIGGVHGADRLGGDMMATTQVFGERAGRYASQYAERAKSDDASNLGKKLLEQIKEKFRINSEPCKIDIPSLEDEIKDLMWKNVGITRKGKDLQNSLKKLQNLEVEFFDIISTKTPKEFSKAFSVGVMFDIAKLLVKAALKRKESRGPHYREDYPERNDEEYNKWGSIKKDERDGWDISLVEVESQESFFIF